MSKYWVQGLYEIPVVRHPVGRIYSYCIIRFAIKHGQHATKLLFFIQKSLNSMDQHEIFHLGGTILVGFHPGLEIFVIIMAKYESSIWVT